MRKVSVFLLPALLLLAAGCHSHSEHSQGEPVVTSNSKKLRVVDYTTSDPRLEPTLNVGGVLEVRTANGGPVVLQSQVERQRRAADEQLRANAEVLQPVAPTPGNAKP